MDSYFSLSSLSKICVYGNESQKSYDPKNNNTPKISNKLFPFLRVSQITCFENLPIFIFSRNLVLAGTYYFFISSSFFGRDWKNKNIGMRQLPSISNLQGWGNKIKGKEDIFCFLSSLFL